MPLPVAGSDPVLIDLVDGIATVTLNRPDHRNALDLGILGGLLSGLTRLAEDSQVRAVILRGAGRSFCVGADVNRLADTERWERPDRPTRDWMRIAELLHGMPKPTIAAINGACAGGGLSIAAACDLRYAAASAVFATAYLRVGIPGDFGGIWSLTQAVGAAKARELFLLGRRLTAGEADKAGLVHAVLADADLFSHVEAVAAQLAGRSAHALAAMKANLDDALDLGFGEYLDRETERFDGIVRSDETQAAARAFLENR